MKLLKCLMFHHSAHELLQTRSDFSRESLRCGSVPCAASERFGRVANFTANSALAHFVQRK